MGYCIEMTLRNVKFKTSDWQEIREKLIEWNEKVLIPKSDWCRFSSNIEDPEELFEDIGFSALNNGVTVEIGEFEREKLGSHQEMFVILAPYLQDCEIVYEGEDGEDWKQVIKDHVVSVIDRPKL